MLSWENRLQKAKLPPKINSSYENVIYIGKFLDNIGVIGHDGGETVWYYLEKSHKWQPEYEIILQGLDFIKDDDLGALEEYMDENSLYSLEELESHIQEREE